jgi:hypothetical protein
LWSGLNSQIFLGRQAMANIVAIVDSEVEYIESDERCVKCNSKFELDEDANLVLVRNGRYLNVALACNACVAETKMQYGF